MPQLIKMNAAQYDAYITDKIERYAATLQAHTFDVTALSPIVRATKAINGYLPHGFHSENHEFYHIVQAESVLGYVWLKVNVPQQSAFLYEIYVQEAFRSQGIGKDVMQQLEDMLVARNILFFKLHVFGSNAPAIHLYEQLGFHVAGINMYKPLHKESE